MDGDFIHGGTGASSSALLEIYREVCTEDADDDSQTIFAPVFDVAYLREEMVATFDPQAESPEGYNNGGGFAPAGGGSAHSWYYHIVGFAKVACGGEKKDTHVLNGTFQEAAIGAGVMPEGWSGEGTCSGTLHGIALWE
jgi:hypothetical protein